MTEKTRTTLRLEQPGRLSEVLLQPWPQVEEMLAPEPRYLLPQERAEQPQVWEEPRASAEQAAPV
ncbi:MAG: hypothetical protein AABZ34_10720 [Nitrospirota bacterium]